MKSLVDKFLSLRCAGDVLESLQPLTGDVTRRIAESMALIEAIRPLVLKQKGEYKLIEFCWGAPMTAVIAAHLLPIEHAMAFVQRRRSGVDLERVQHLKSYDLDSDAERRMDSKTIIVAPSVMPEHAMRISMVCKAENAPMAIIPSRGKVKLSSSSEEVAKITGNRYFAWLQELAESCDGNVRVPTNLVDSGAMNCCLVTRGL